MGKIFCIMGKSSTGKDTLYKSLIQDSDLNLKSIVTYTTRPIREGEKDGVEYHFTDEEGYQKLQAEGKVIEARKYDTIHGIWRYFTVDDGNIIESENYLLIGTIEAFISLKKYFGEKRVIPLLVETDDGERLARALKRERKQATPKYEELCRRFLCDAQDFSEDKIKAAGISERFFNDKFDDCLNQIKEAIRRG